MNGHPEEPKLIIDEDWKAQVEREKAEFEQRKASRGAAPEQGATATEPSGSATEATPPQSDRAPQTDMPLAESERSTTTSQSLPPASLPILVASLGAQAMASLGQLPGEEDPPLPINLDFAKHFIDLIGVIEEKTQGNLSADEAGFLRDTLYQLRLTFVDVKSRQSK